MKKNRLLFLILLMASAKLCFAQSGWFTVKNELPQTNDLFFTSSDTGYIIGNDALARKSRDGGITWNSMTIENDYKGKANFISLSFPTSQVGYIAGNETNGFGIILKTTDAGNTWIKTSYSFPYYIDKIIFPSASLGYITTDFNISNGSIYMLMKSRDGGNLWGMLDSTQDVKIEQMVWKNEDLGLFMSNHLGDPPESYLAYTSDGGNRILPAGNTGVYDKTTVGSGAGNVWYCGLYYSLYRSEDTNFHWMSTNGTHYGDIDYGTFFIANGDSSYCVRNRYSGVTIFKTIDNGLNWYHQFNDTSLNPIAGCAPTLQIAFLLASYDSSRKWKILKTIDGGGAALSVILKQIGYNLSLSPNPTTGILSIRNATENLTGISILNVLGEKVMEIAAPHSADFTIDLSKLPAGMHYARITLPNEVVMRKIIKE